MPHYSSTSPKLIIDYKVNDCSSDKQGQMLLEHCNSVLPSPTQSAAPGCPHVCESIRLLRLALPGWKTVSQAMPLRQIRSRTTNASNTTLWWSGLLRQEWQAPLWRWCFSGSLFLLEDLPWAAVAVQWRHVLSVKIFSFFFDISSLLCSLNKCARWSSDHHHVPLSEKVSQWMLGFSCGSCNVWLVCISHT